MHILNKIMSNSRLAGNSMRVLKVVVASYLVLALIATYYFIAHYPLEMSANLIFDDAYYYLGVAKNIADGRGSSFGNLVQTNGYQPLWLFVLAAVIYIFSFPKFLAFVSILTLVFIIKSFSLFNLSALKGPQAIPLLLATGLAIMLYPGIFSDGLETCLILFCVPLISQLKEFHEGLSIKTCLKYSAIFTLLFLIRLDLLSIMAAFYLVSILKLIKKKRHIRKNLAVTFLLTACAVSIYFLANFRLFGTFLPISGLSKSIGNRVGENVEALAMYLISARLAIVALALIFILKRTFKGSEVAPSLFTNELRMTIISAFIVAFYYAFFSGWPLWNWYYWPTALVTLYAVAELIQLSYAEIKRYHRSRRLYAVVLSSWVFLGYVGLLAIKTEYSNGVIRTLVSLQYKEIEPTYSAMNVRLVNSFFKGAPNGIVAMGDRAGGLGYWLPDRFKFFHTEGLVANKDYMTARKSGKGLEYLQNLGIKYFVVERERLFEAKSADGTLVHGIVEPIQGLSVHSGLVLICLPESSILYTQRYESQVRYVYDFTKTTTCPPEIISNMNALAETYGELRKFSLPSEYKRHGFFRNYIWNPPP